MYGLDFEREMAADRMREYGKEAGNRRLARMVSADETSFRGRVAKYLVAAAMRLECGVTRDAVWKKTEAPKHS